MRHFFLGFICISAVFFSEKSSALLGYLERGQLNINFSEASKLNMTGVAAILNDPERLITNPTVIISMGRLNNPKDDDLLEASVFRANALGLLLLKITALQKESRITGVVFRDINAEGVIILGKIQAANPQITQLTLENFVAPMPSPKALNAAIQRLATVMPNVESLTIKNCRMGGDISTILGQSLLLFKKLTSHSFLNDDLTHMVGEATMENPPPLSIPLPSPLPSRSISPASGLHTPKLMDKMARDIVRSNSNLGEKGYVMTEEYVRHLISRNPELNRQTMEMIIDANPSLGREWLELVPTLSRPTSPR